jgi:hypothetical protein
MTQDEIIDKDEVLKMARQAGMVTDGEWWFSSFYKIETDVHISHLEAFAKLVADAVADKAAEREREACAKVCDELGEHWGDYKDTALLNGDVDLSNAASGEPRAAARLATAIRARGTHE